MDVGEIEFLEHGVENSSLNCLKFVKREKKQASVVVRNLEVNDRNGIDLITLKNPLSDARLQFAGRRGD